MGSRPQGKAERARLVGCHCPAALDIDGQDPRLTETRPWVVSLDRTDPFPVVHTHTHTRMHAHMHTAG